MAATNYARLGRQCAVPTSGAPIYTRPSDAQGLVDLDALKAAGLNRNRHSHELLAKHRQCEMRQVNQESLTLKFTFAVEHLASGRRDGNYFDRDKADEMLAHWCTSFPLERFRLIQTPVDVVAWPVGATNGAPPLRAFDARLWAVMA